MADIVRAKHPEERCTFVIPHIGQCNNKVVDGCDKCLVHGGNKKFDSNQREAVRNYNLARIRAEHQRHADSPIIKSLREEVGLLRLVLEKYINRAQTETDLILIAPQIQSLITDITKTVTQCHKLETSLGSLVDKHTLGTFTMKLIQIISEYLPENKLSEVADRISVAFEEATSERTS